MSDKELSDEEVKEVTSPETKMKKENSYTYWVNNDPNYFKNCPDIKPKPIEEADIEKLKNVDLNKKDSHSAWNTAGTWEEKKLELSQVKDILEKNMINFKSADGKAKIIKLTKCEGDATIVLSRGKKRIGYHLTISFKFQDVKDPALHGHINFQDVLDDGDYEYNLDQKEGKEGVSKETLQNSVKSVAQAMFDSINKLKEIYNN